MDGFVGARAVQPGALLAGLPSDSKAHQVAAHASLAFAAINGQVGGTGCGDLEAGCLQKGGVLLSNLLDLLEHADPLPHLTLLFLPLHPLLLLLLLFPPSFLLHKEPLALLLPLGGLCLLLLSLNNTGLIIPNGRFHKSLDQVDLHDILYANAWS